MRPDVAGQVQRSLGNRLVSRLVSRMAEEGEQEAAGCGCERADGGCDCKGETDVAPEEGEPLSPLVRRRMDDGFGSDLSHVRVHTGPRADAEARRLDAAAFTISGDIWIRTCRYAPATWQGEWLLAHEVTHTLQQRGTSGSGPAEQGPAP